MMSPKREASGATARRALLSACRGEAGKMFYVACWLPALATVWAACFLLAWRAYPGYDIPSHDISDLGHPAMNRHGWWFWSIGMALAALMALPAIAYASRRMAALAIAQAPAEKRLVALGTTCLYGACWGLAGLALAPQGSTFDTLHIISGVFAMGGVYVTLLFLWGAPLFNAREMSAPRVALLTVATWWGVAGFLSTQGYRFFAYGELGHDLKHKSESVLLRFSLWEWMLFAAVTTSFALLVALLPEKGAGRE